MKNDVNGVRIFHMTENGAVGRSEGRFLDRPGGRGLNRAGENSNLAGSIRPENEFFKV